MIVAMSNRTRKLLKDALALPPEELSQFMDSLWAAAAESDDPDVREAWDAELARRIDDIDSGCVKTVAWASVQRALRRLVRHAARRPSAPMTLTAHPAVSRPCVDIR
ncbi:MAG: hypothetical protein CHACPFDD_00539 [Phycisphaerae bacterium]|nr:hypothetical protein [Phycisphaerae bacterium]